jgi:hypothetical protein
MVKRSFPLRVGEKMDREIKDLMGKNPELSQREASDIIAGAFENLKRSQKSMSREIRF